MAWELLIRTDTCQEKVDGDHLVGQTIKDHMNYVTRMKMKLIEAGDAHTLIDILSQQGAQDEDFFYRVKLDDEGRLSNVFFGGIP